MEYSVEMEHIQEFLFDCQSETNTRSVNFSHPLDRFGKLFILFIYFILYLFYFIYLFIYLLFIYLFIYYLWHLSENIDQPNRQIRQTQRERERDLLFNVLFSFDSLAWEKRKKRREGKKKKGRKKRGRSGKGGSSLARERSSSSLLEILFSISCIFFFISSSFLPWLTPSFLACLLAYWLTHSLLPSFLAPFTWIHGVDENNNSKRE